MPSFVLLNQNTTLAPKKGTILGTFPCGTLLNITEHYSKHFLQSTVLQFLQVS